MTYTERAIAAIELAYENHAGIPEFVVLEWRNNAADKKRAAALVERAIAYLRDHPLADGDYGSPIAAGLTTVRNFASGWWRDRL